jgi:hypothetical protein
MGTVSLYSRALAAIGPVDGPPQVEVLRIGHGTITVLARPSMMEQARRALAQSPGRPPNTLEHNLLLHAAFCTERDKGLSLVDARGAAAKRLGAKVTAEKVRRATSALQAELTDWFGLDAAEKHQELVQETQLLLKRLQAQTTALPARHFQRGNSAAG